MNGYKKHNSSVIYKKIRMKRYFVLLIVLFAAASIYAQKVSHEFRGVSMSKALKWIEASTKDYTINFIYNELEDFTVTTTVRDKTVPETIRQIIGFYPMKLTIDGKNIFVECVQKQKHKFIGRVIDYKGVPVQFANIVLMQPSDSTYITGGVCNENGEFVIPCDENRVLARISYVGCQTLFTIFDRSNVGNVRLYTQVTRIKSVTVTATRPTITQKGDRLVVDIHNSSLAFGNSVQNLLQQLPGVWSGSGNITINGIPGAKVMVDNRDVNLKGEALSQYLSSMKSENIDKIEVIAHPGAEFSAEGAGGVIRIITRGRYIGQELTLGGTLDAIQYKALEPNVRYSFSNQKFGFDVSYDGTFTYGNNNYMNSDEYTENLKKQITYDDKMIDYMKDHIYNLQTNLYYDFSKRSKLALYASLSQWAKDEDMESTTLIGGVGTNDISRTQTAHLENQKMHSVNSSLNYTYSLDKKENHKLLFMADYVRQYHYYVDDDYTYLNYGSSDNLISQENERNKQNKPYTIASSEIRYTGNLGSAGMITSGIKGSYSTVWNSLSVFQLENSKWTAQTDMGYDFKYDERLQAAYLKYSLSKKAWSLTAGLREEYVKANTNVAGSTYHHIDLFPSFYLSRSFSDNHQLSVSYNRRTNRVSYFSLIPYRFYSSRYTIIEGNPNLKPNFSNTVALSYNFKKRYFCTATYHWSNNGMSSYNTNEVVNDRAMTVSTKVDGEKQRLFNFNIYAPVTISKRWSMVNQAEFNYNSFKTTEINNHSFNWNIYTRQTIILPADIQFELLYRYTSSQRTAYGRSNDYHTLNASFMKRFLDNSLTTKLSLSDIICCQKNRTTVTTPDIIQRSDMYGKHVPFVSLSISYTFRRGNKRDFKDIEHSNGQEMNRTY